MIHNGDFSPNDRGLFRPISDSLLTGGDRYLILADFASYVDCQSKVSQAYRDPTAWTRMSILNVAHMGKFSSDRSVQQYCDEIWQAKPVKV
jgi:starch phosphorylase